MAHKQACTCFTARLRRLIRRCRVFPQQGCFHKGCFRHINRLAQASPDLHMQWWKLLPRSLLRLEQVCRYFATLRRIKRRCRVFPAHKQVCMSFTGPPQWRKLVSPFLLALKQAYTCFAALPRRLIRRCRVGCTNFTAPPQRWKLLSPWLLALKQASTYFTALPREL